MTEEVKTAEELEAENKAQDQDEILDENDTQKNEEDQTVEDTDPSGDDEKQEDSPYKKQLDELNEELSKKDDIIDKKNRALEAEKKKRKELEKAKDSEVNKEGEVIDKVSLKEEVKAELKAELVREKVSELISEYTTDKVERELVQKIYDFRIVKTGNLTEDLESAIAIANKSLVQEAKSRAKEQDEEETDMFSSMSSHAKSSVKGLYKDPSKRVAAQLLRSMGMEQAIKHLK